MRLLSSFAGSACLCLVFGHAAHAAITLRLEPSGSVTVNSGETAVVELFLDDDGNHLNLQGLASGGGRLLLEVLSSATVVVDSVTLNPGFDDPFSSIFDGSDPLDAPLGGDQNLAGFYAFISLGQDNPDPDPDIPPSSPVGVGVNSILLATFELTITGNAGESATVSPATFANDPTSFQTLISGNPNDLTNFDALVNTTNGVTFFIAAPGGPGVVPEPGSWTLFLGLGACALAYLRRKKTLVG